MDMSTKSGHFSDFSPQMVNTEHSELTTGILAAVVLTLPQHSSSVLQPPLLLQHSLGIALTGLCLAGV